MPRNIEIRAANREDIGTIKTIFESAIDQLAKNDYTQKQREAWKKRGSREEFWISKMDDQRFYIAVDDKITIGFTSIDDNGCIDFLYVSPSFKRRGIATALYEHLLATINTQHTHTLITKASLTAKPFFENLGFIPIEENHNLLADQDLINYTMIKQLSNLNKSV